MASPLLQGGGGKESKIRKIKNQETLVIGEQGLRKFWLATEKEKEKKKIGPQNKKFFFIDEYIREKTPWRQGKVFMPALTFARNVRRKRSNDSPPI